MESFVLSITQYLSNHAENWIQILFSAAIGFLIGWDREAKSKPAGIKTYMYVCTACCLITIISINSVGKFSHAGEKVMMDPMRLAAQIVSGLGFLGAGVILKNGLQVKGLTSAAMILYVGGIGIGIGAGFYELVIFTYVVAAILAKVGNKLESKKMSKFRKPESEIEIRLN